MLTSVAALTVGALLAVAVRRTRAEAAEQASWVQITPPAVMPADGARGLWRALAGLLSRTGRGLAPRHLAVEFVADATGMRAGVWVPPALSASSVAEVIGRCWPGARATVTNNPPALSRDSAGRVTAAYVLPCGGPWAPLLDPTRATRRQAAEVDGLHSVLAALADRGETDSACVQLIVSPAHAGRPRGDRSRSWWARIALGFLKAPFVIILAIADVFLGKGSAASHEPAAATSAPEDPAVAAYRKAIAAKQAHGPHLQATLRLAVCSPVSRRLRRRAVNELVNGYDLAAPAAILATHPAHRAERQLAQRLPGRRQDRFLVTLDEAAALWHLPDQPAQYGITDATARIRRPRRDLPRFDPRRPKPDQPEGGHDAAA
ncbi:hypothetical protein SK803_37090 [Lentzea sp. BCCO 10_0856]|uniref:Uncharacterized protein n=1 Tax=Lentzea miocenica TaxID=3095431 RepID=A0ABU4TCF6_9PSEU|nr:hypothetical protein [Lentzea sp. BCCO 10_0856]MDX8035846.1 hypothetical protein [Lentzea sp. BCCO 10_0856]